eukprot:gene39163-47579_t
MASVELAGTARLWNTSGAGEAGPRNNRRPLGHLGLGALMALTLGLGLGLSLAVTTPARADDDGAGSMFGSILSTVTGVGKAKDVELPVEYRERAPLVVPPNK